MSAPDDTDKTIAGTAALSICESLLLALNDLKILSHTETRGLLEDAAETHRNAISVAANPDEHRAFESLIDRLIEGMSRRSLTPSGKDNGGQAASRDDNGEKVPLRSQHT